jgi:O-antigen/teichoic acid export membrane protein
MKRFLTLQDTFETYYIALTFILYTALYLFIIPFVRLYTKGVEDISYVDPLMPPLMILNTLLTSGRLASNQVINFAGEFKNTKNSSLIETGINLVVSLVLVQFIGIYGVLLGTIFALLYRANYMISYANKKILKRSPKATYRRWFINFGIFLVTIIAFTGVFYNLDSYFKIVLWGGISLIVLSCVYLAVNSFFEREAYMLAKKKVFAVLKTKS